MKDIQIFKSEEFGEVRTVTIEGNPYFVGKDVAVILGYAKPLNALATHIDEDDSLKQGLIDSMGRMQETIFINESGLYSLILSSKLPNAKKFKSWVTADVLPTIRKHGMYATEELLDNPDLIIQVITALKEERAKSKALTFEVKVKDQQILEMKPKVTYYDVVLQCPDLLTMTEIAKDYGMSAKRMNEILHSLGIQYFQSGVWFLYQKYAEYGYTQTRTYTFFDGEGMQRGRVHTYWTQKGRLFIYETLKKQGIVPLIELETV